MIEERNMLRQVQLVQLGIAKEIKRICEENEIRYFLEGGTLLGAVRHKGFIPWDDDLDIGMLRNDYEKFIKIAPEALREEYILQTWESDPYYGFPYAKVQKRNTVYLENVSQKTKALHGIFVDVFPFDNFPTKKGQKFLQGIEITFLKIFMRAKCGYMPWIDNNGRVDYKKFLCYMPIKLISLVVNKSAICKYYDFVAKRYNLHETPSKFPQGISHYGKFVVSSSDIRNYESLIFEDEYFSVPKGYKNYLTSLYGDYMTPPPISERTNRHGVAKIKL